MTNIYFVSRHEPETVLNSLHVLPHLNPTTTCKYNYYTVKCNNYYTIIILRSKVSTIIILRKLRFRDMNPLLRSHIW